LDTASQTAIGRPTGLPLPKLWKIGLFRQQKDRPLATLSNSSNKGYFPQPFLLDVIAYQGVHCQEMAKTLTISPMPAYLVRQVSATHARKHPMEPALNSPPSRSAITRHKPEQRSRVTNGKRYFVEGDQRGPWARRWRDVLAEIVNDLGGADLLSEGQKQLARRCATIAIACERMEGEAAQGNEIDLDGYGRLTDRLGRALQRLGLKRKPREIETLSDYMAINYPQEPSP
jgi:hypothetical protein